MRRSTFLSFLLLLQVLHLATRHARKRLKVDTKRPITRTLIHVFRARRFSLTFCHVNNFFPLRRCLGRSSSPPPTAQPYESIEYLHCTTVHYMTLSIMHIYVTPAPLSVLCSLLSSCSFLPFPLLLHCLAAPLLVLFPLHIVLC